MAKSGRKPGQAARARGGSSASAQNDDRNVRVDETLVDLAEDLGKLLGTAQRRMSTWLGERQEIATQLVQIRDTANAYLRDLTSGGATLAAAIERGRRTSKTGVQEETKTTSGSSHKPRTPPGRKTTARKT